MMRGCGGCCDLDDLVTSQSFSSLPTVRRKDSRVLTTSSARSVVWPQGSGDMGPAPSPSQHSVTPASSAFVQPSASNRLDWASFSQVPQKALPGERRCPRLTRLVTSSGFELAVAVAIFGNCATAGLEAEILLGNAQNWDVFVKVTSHAFTIAFTVELIVRALVYGWRSFVPGLGGSVGNLVDASIVLVSGVLAQWVFPYLPLGIVQGSHALQTLTVLRALRLIRVVRIVSRVRAFHEVWLLLRGLTQSMRVLMWTVVVLFFVTYVFAVLGVVLLSSTIQEKYEAALYTPEEDELEVVKLEALNSVLCGIFPLMFTLVQVLTLDSWTAVARPLMTHISWSWIFFYLYICIAVFVLMNLITSIIIDNAMTMSRQDAEEVLMHRELERQGSLRQFQRLFSSIDADGSGTLTREEFRAAFEDPEIANQLCLLDIHFEDCEEIFNLLDTGDGVLSLQEFFEGVMRMEGGATAKDLFRVLKTTQYMAKAMRGQVGMKPPACTSPAQVAQGRGGCPRQGNARLPDTAVAGKPCSSGGPPAGTLLEHPQPGFHLGHVLQRLDEIATAVSSCNAKIEACQRDVGALAVEHACLRDGAKSTPWGQKQMIAV